MIREAMARSFWRSRFGILPDDTAPTTWYSVGTNEKERLSQRNPKTRRCVMENIMWMVKMGLLYGLEIFVVAVVGVTIIAGLYQLIRSRVRGVGEQFSHPTAARTNG